MADRLSVARRSANMGRIRSRNTKPEMLVRRMLHRFGYRYSVHVKDLPGKPDLVFTARRKVIFVHGCFWHQHDRKACSDSRKPKSNTEYWTRKLDRNVMRDAEHLETLREKGWDALVIWDCETADEEALRGRLAEFLGPPRNWQSCADQTSRRKV